MRMKKNFSSSGMKKLKHKIWVKNLHRNQNANGCLNRSKGK